MTKVMTWVTEKPAYVPVPVMVPDTAPVEALSVRPSGREKVPGVVAVNERGDVPPDAVTAHPP
jgi:hypothetical protein